MYDIPTIKELVEELRWYSENRYDCDYKLLMKTIDKAADIIEAQQSELDELYKIIQYQVDKAYAETENDE